MRHLPIEPYCGLTIVLSQPSRQDIHQLLSNYAGTFFSTECLGPYSIRREQCDIRISETKKEGLINGTRGLLLLGDRAFQEWTEGKYSDYNLNEQRGCPLITNYGIPTIASYSPQDCIDMRDWETAYNKHLNNESGAQWERDADDGDEYSEKKRHGRTSRGNFRHWLRRDTAKLVESFQRSFPKSEGFLSGKDFDIRPYSPSDEIIHTLLTHTGEYLYLDIETDSDYNCLCIGFNFSSSTNVYVIPLIRYDYTLAYSNFHKILRALVTAFKHNTVVIHNSMFDLFVLAWKYKIPPPLRVFDTMIAQHRIFPEAEKSLGHCLTAWPEICEPFHKDEGVFMPWNIGEEKQLWNYNGKDVYGMRLVHEAQMRTIERIKGMPESVRQAMRAIRPFLLMQLQGILVDDKRRQEVIKNNDKVMGGYLRAISHLTGPNINLLPTSSPSCIKYFHDALGYPVVGRSTETGKPSLDETNLLKLKLKNPHCVTIDFCIKYRERKKESGTLGFKPWIP